MQRDVPDDPAEQLRADTGGGSVSDRFDDRRDDGSGWHEPEHLGRDGGDPRPDEPAAPWEPPGWSLPSTEPDRRAPAPPPSQAPPPDPPPPHLPPSHLPPSDLPAAAPPPAGGVRGGGG